MEQKVVKKSSTTFLVDERDRTFVVKKIEGAYSCNCIDFLNPDNNRPCKHIQRVVQAIISGRYRDETEAGIIQRDIDEWIDKVKEIQRAMEIVRKAHQEGYRPSSPIPRPETHKRVFAHRKSPFKAFGL